eukprot:563342-Hanusia_phi.AAC.2
MEQHAAVFGAVGAFTVIRDDRNIRGTSHSSLPDPQCSDEERSQPVRIVPLPTPAFPHPRCPPPPPPPPSFSSFLLSFCAQLKSWQGAEDRACPPGDVPARSPPRLWYGAATRSMRTGGAGVLYYT